ncbi:response regulator [Belnapia sp. T18]|uniref:histidine kinase n=2 Tax=Belnapia arida TaxID=2804533 RepID=A0ABS1UHD4_9PROT|nr:response regulator [Belnapia arida]
MAGVVMDTTERKMVEERLRQSEKMEAVGQLTGGVAHDFNNLLTVVTGALSMIARAPDRPDRVARLAEAGLQASRRGADLTSKLLAFSRRQMVRPEVVDPNRLLEEFVPLLRRAAGETVAIELDLAPDLDPARVDPGQLEATVLNLVVNARDAMPGGGRVRIETRNARLSAAELADMPEVAPAAYLQIAVGDTGTGMDETTRARAFEPFFTTKEVGKGTGLGLSQVYGFARQAGGHVRLLSAPGQGTTVEIYLPRSEERTPVRHAEDRAPPREATGGEVVLVVEDEPAVLDMAVESVRELGYGTLAARDAAEALEHLQSGERIDVLFSDVVMPGGVDGIQLAERARRLRPDLRILLTSGYSASVVGHEIPKGLPLLLKPYVREDLAAKLTLVVGESNAPKESALQVGP